MLNYDDVIAELEDAWITHGLHEHTLTESVVPDSHDRTYRAELFPEHGDPLTEENMPPWVELNFTWSASHQLRAEGRDIATEPLFLTWTYMVFVRGALRERSDEELANLFQRALRTALHRLMPDGDGEPLQFAVEIRRIYQSIGAHATLAYMQLVSANITDMTDQWNEGDPATLRHMIHFEVQLVSAVIYALADIFTPGPPGNYHAARTA